MVSLSTQEKLMVVFVWGIALFMLSTSLYAIFFTVFSAGQVIRDVGIALLMFAGGLTPQMFTKPIPQIFKQFNQFSPMYFTLKTRSKILNVGMLLLILGCLLAGR